MTHDEMRQNFLVQKVFVTSRKHVGIDLKSAHVDGSGVQVFIKHGQPDFYFTDFGHTFFILDSNGVDYTKHLPWIHDVLSQLGVTLVEDQLTCDTPDFDTGLKSVASAGLAITLHLLRLDYSNV